MKDYKKRYYSVIDIILKNLFQVLNFYNMTEEEIENFTEDCINQPGKIDDNLKKRIFILTVIYLTILYKIRD